MSRLAFLTAAVLAAAAPAQAEVVAIVGAKVETLGPAGALESGVVLIRDGRILKVGADVKPPPGARIINAAGKVVTPGLIAASTTLMVEEIQGVATTRDDMARGKLGAAYDVAYGLNPASTLVPLARQGGLTRAFVTPTGGRGYGEDLDEDLAADTAGAQDPASPAGGLFAGQAAGVRLSAGDKDPLFRPRAAIAVDLGDAGARVAGSHAGALILFKSALEEAKAYGAARAAYARGATRAFALSREDLEALQPVVRGETPLLVRVHRAADIRQVLKIASALKVKVILEDAEEAWMEADALAASHTPVLIDTEADLPEQFETLGSRLDNAARLEKAGVLVAIEGSRSFGNYRQARLNAGTAVANGLPYAAALRALTLNPARIWGVADRLGSLEAGKAADLVVWSGDPLETSTYPEAVFIEGVEQPQDSRAFKLRDRYAAPAGDLPPAYH